MQHRIKHNMKNKKGIKVKYDMHGYENNKVTKVNAVNNKGVRRVRIKAGYIDFWG